jgi:methionyl-tRNA formyltransferase
MRILLLANNWVGWQVARWMKQRRDEIVGLVIHPPSRQKYGAELLRSLPLPAEQIFDGAQLRRPEIMQAIKELEPDIGVSVLFGYILRKAFTDIFPSGVINVHPSYLPFNRGVYPNVWSIVDGTPAGASVHYIDEGVDSGDIIAQRQIPVELVDTGETLYRKLERLCVELFQETWPLILSGQASRTPQAHPGTLHRVCDLERIDEIDMDRMYTGRELINILRARTFPPHAGAFLRRSEGKIYIRVDLLTEDQLREEERGSRNLDQR